MVTYESVNEKGQKLCQLIASELGDYPGDALVFVGALGICVRKVLPKLHDKHTDQAVVCVDTLGKYAIPVAGGHVGGANRLARRIAKITGGEAIITTQSDTMGLWQLDTLADDNGWLMRTTANQHADMNRAIAAFVNGNPTALVIEHHDRGTEKMERTLPDHVTVFHSYADFAEQNTAHTGKFQLLILVSPRLHPSANIPTVHYCPPVLHLGIGCQKSAPTSIATAITQRMEAMGYARQSVTAVCTIELKRDEPLIHTVHEHLPWATLRIFSADQLSQMAVPNPSDRVSEATGSASVSEASALMSADGGTLLIAKQKGEEDGHHYTFALAMTPQTEGHVEFVGAGPGDPELLSIRGRHFLERADLILYAGSLVPVSLTECAKPGSTVRNSAGMTLEEQLRLMHDFTAKGKLVVRLHTGDPCIYGAIQEQMAYLDTHGISYHITPGISSFQAAAAELRSQFTIPERCQTIILTRGEGRTPVPERESLRSLAAHQCTICIFLSASLARHLQEELLAGGYPADTPVAVCHKLTWAEQKIVRGKLSELADIVEKNSLTLTTMLVVGEAIDNRKGTSLLYDKQFKHLYRQKNDTDFRRNN